MPRHALGVFVGRAAKKRMAFLDEPVAVVFVAVLFTEFVFERVPSRLLIGQGATSDHDGCLGLPPGRMLLRA